MPTAFLCVYISPPPKRGFLIPLDTWPYDIGDDPSFYCSQKVDGPVTWSICRPDVRKLVKPTDVVVFFSSRSTGGGKPIEYRLCALATVGRKIRHTDIWTEPEFKLYQRYYNLLVRPVGRGIWEQFEPLSPPNKPHDDWICRIVDYRGAKLHKKALVPLCKSGKFSEDTKVAGKLLRVADNYVVFSPLETHTFIVPQPPLVALCPGNRRPEEWLEDSVSRRIRGFTLDSARARGGRDRHSLRTINPRNPHRHITWHMSPRELGGWRKQFLSFLRSL